MLERVAKPTPHFFDGMVYLNTYSSALPQGLNYNSVLSVIELACQS
jgi:hypothetical protein